MPYTPAKPPLSETPDELRARIPGWGADIDPRVRPSVPRLQPTRDAYEGDDTMPERQPETYARERSIEHLMLPPVFGTSCPPHGLSGAIRRYSYRRFSEARAAHWLLLIGADRVESVGTRLRSLASLRPDLPLTRSGLRSEVTRHGVRSRVGRQRADLAIHAIDPVLRSIPWLTVAATASSVLRRRRRRMRALDPGYPAA
jgi:hypothetical protein